MGIPIAIRLSNLIIGPYRRGRLLFSVSLITDAEMLCLDDVSSGQLQMQLISAFGMYLRTL
jgi:hypothetical protein